MPQFPRSLDEILAMFGGGPVDPPPLPPSPLQGVPLNTPRPWLTDPQGQAGRQGPPVDDPMLALRGASSIGPVERPPGYEVADWMTQGMAGGEPGPADLLMAAAPFVGKPLRAFHGSPHNFDRFDLSKIGTGEGAQVRGYGHYFAEEPATAESYRKRLSRGYSAQTDEELADYFRPGAIVPSYGGLDRVIEFRVDDPRRLGQWGVLVEEVKQAPDGSYRAIGRPRWHSTSPRSEEYEAVTGKKLGSTYEVDLSLRPDQIIDQDRTLDKQPHVIDKLRGGHFMDEAGRTDTGNPIGLGPSQQPEDTTGRDLTKRMYDLIGFTRKTPYVSTSAEGGQQAVELARYLRQRDLHGSQFLDQGSRQSGEGTRNYVVWNDAIIDIIKKYGLLPPATIAAIEAERQTQTPTTER